jgi:HAD superfamily hydrolase (TIGR01484 family)
LGKFDFLTNLASIPGFPLFLDYDGTLVPIQKDPLRCFADKPLIGLLHRLMEHHEVYIVTGRSLDEIDRMLGEKLDAVTWHGNIARVHGRIQYLNSRVESTIETIDSILLNRERFEESYPGLKVYSKNPGVLFHLWDLSAEMGQKLHRELLQISQETGTVLYSGKGIYEIIPPDSSKGNAIRLLREGREALIAGDDATDEESFRVNSDTFTVKVGQGETAARHRVSDYMEMRRLLEFILSSRN